MRVGLDVQLARGTATGIGEYARGLLAALRDAGTDVVALEAPGVDPWRFDRRVLWDQVLLPLAARRARVEVVHCASGTMPLFCGRPIVVTVHDVAWHRAQAHTRPYARAYFGAFALTRYRTAARILVDSAFSRDELLTLAPLDPARVEVVYPGVAADVMGVVRAPDRDRPYALAVGTVEQRKNLEVAIRALAQVPGVRLVSAGPPTPYLERCAALARELGVAERVEFRGYVARDALLELYAGATVAVVPSRYEGFGYGAAQALAAGLPLIAARTSSLPEVVGAAGSLVGPDDVPGWSAALTAVVAAPEAAEARAAGGRRAAAARFGWPQAARAAAAAYAGALAGDSY
jgi:glycosyltransferase involved in cell wall biosynthesis